MTSGGGASGARAAAAPLLPAGSRDEWRELERALTRAVSDLQGPPTVAERLAAGGRLAGLAVVFAAAVAVFWLRPLDGLGLAALPLAGLAYALVLIASHEMAHGTWLGWRALEFALGCLLAWPMAWPFATYARLHRLHHRWNGRDPRDPERTQPLPGDPPPTTPLERWRERHPFAMRCLLLGGIGLIVDTAWQGWRLRGVDPRLDRALLLDGAGVLAVQAGVLALVLQQGTLLRYGLFWLVLERVMGAISHYRGLVEHHGLWPEAADPAVVLPQRLRQLATTRDVACGARLQALLGGLPHHSTHHAFPWLPTARLPEASVRLQAVLQERGWPPPHRLEGYGQGVKACGGARSKGCFLSAS